MAVISFVTKSPPSHDKGRASQSKSRIWASRISERIVIADLPREHLALGPLFEGEAIQVVLLTPTLDPVAEGNLSPLNIEPVLFVEDVIRLGLWDSHSVPPHPVDSVACSGGSYA